MTTSINELANGGNAAKKMNALYGKRTQLRRDPAPATSGYDVRLQAEGCKIDPAVLRDALAEIQPQLEQHVSAPKGAHSALRVAARRCQAGVARLGGRAYRWAEIKAQPGTAANPDALAFALTRVEGVTGDDAAACSLTATHEATVLVLESTGAFDADVDTASSVGAAALRDAVAKLQKAYDEERGTLDASLLWGLTKAVAVATGEGCVAFTKGAVLVQKIAGLEHLQAALDLAWSRAHPMEFGPVLIAREVNFGPPPAGTTASPLTAGTARSVEQTLLENLARYEAEFKERVAQSVESGRALRDDAVEGYVAKVLAERESALLLGELLQARAARVIAEADRLEKFVNEAAAKSWQDADARALDKIKSSRKGK